ncbi:MAG: baseplate J/gp47 family protein [Lachnospiraceae bacterium]|nr:baseplate J/gp47 family protein [Lachnospiraceae bacterium]
MLRVEQLQGRTYEERMDDILRELPLRSSEWTNYNPSDPGITILENLTAFSALQGAEIVALSYRARMALLKMAGFTPARGKCSRVLLSADELETPLTLMSGQRFHLGDICFETNRETTAGAGRVTAVYAGDKDGYKDISFVLDRELAVPARIFGEHPEADNALYIIFDADLSGLHEIIMYIRMVINSRRNQTENRTEHIFADVEWQIHTADGWETLCVRDFTGAFSGSGEIRISLPDTEPTVYSDTPVTGYCLRAVLKRADYDIVPKMTNLYGFLFEVWQKDTYAYSQAFSRADRVTVRSPIGHDVYYLVFGRDGRGEPYRRYELVTGGGMRGRFCRYRETEDGMTFIFDGREYGYAPSKGKECVRVILYNEQIMRRYNVGTVIGYDDQEIALPLEHIVSESFFLIARRQDEEGYTYDFVRPEKKSPGALYYHLLENEGRIVIEDAGDFIGADLYMGSAAVTSGPRGNISAGNNVSMDDGDIPVTFYNPGEGTGGVYRETLQDVRGRFIRDMRTPYTAVTAGDYESIVSTTPGLCIRKTRAVMDERENLVSVVVLPDTDERFPKLSEIYRQRISSRLEERRLITAKFRILQPVYAPVGVKATVYVKRHFADCREQIEERIYSRLDYMNSDHNIGETLRFEDVFHAIEELPCVEYVYELSLHTENSKLAQLKEYDIIPRYDCLIYPGSIQIQIVTSDK